MGEPLHDFEPEAGAELLQHEDEPNFRTDTSPSRPPGWCRVSSGWARDRGRRRPLNATTDEQRRELMPIDAIRSPS